MRVVHEANNRVGEAGRQSIYPKGVLKLILHTYLLKEDNLIKSDFHSNLSTTTTLIYPFPIARSSTDGEAMLGEAACSQVLGGLTEVLCAACDYAHDRCAKLLHAR